MWSSKACAGHKSAFALGATRIVTLRRKGSVIDERMRSPNVGMVCRLLSMLASSLQIES